MFSIPNTAGLLTADSGPDEQLGSAIQLAVAGFKIHRLPPDKKFPPPGDWPNLPHNGFEEVQSLWTDSFGKPARHNIAIQTGIGFFVLDFDTRHGGDGSLSALRSLLPDTFQVTTPNGVHVYLAYNGPLLKNGSDIFAAHRLPGVDLRAHHGYVVGPGSVVNGEKYRMVDDATPIAHAPKEILKMIGERKVTAPVEQIPVAELDTDQALAMAREYLNGPSGLDGDSCDGRTFQTAARLKDFGISEDAAVELLFEHEQAIGDVVEVETFDRAIRNAYQYAREKAPGIEIAKLAVNEFGPVPGDDGPRPTSLSLVREGDFDELGQKDADGEPGRPFFVDAADLLSNPAPPREWHVADWFPARTVSMLMGDGGTGKSFLALQLAVATAT